MKQFIPLGCIVLALSGCSRETPRDKMFYELRTQKDVQTPFPSAGYTYASFDTGHGYQIEYLDSNGRAFLWYPGNRSAVSGEWKIVLDEICYRYDSNTFNPQTLQRGGSWSCDYTGRAGYLVTGYQKGDPFNLRSGKIPYARSKCDLPKGLNQVKNVSCK
ncbi:hypothetical protein [Ruegeria atlantica]|uniref:Lipoprotein n=1 Tax=Ruegeria atlantica TaxID=81569 RepID=A0A0P1E7K5_9RHOB|nr:hypothetical protein [Ruegeria atlantica]CUH44961.1 hypothetical protein RUM4293_03870 [Ruegeria atlantica]